MKLQQLRYVLEIEKQALNISKAAIVLSTSQSGISKQLSLLEDELGIQLFERNAKKLTAITPAGERILVLARQVLSKTDDITQTAAEFTDREKTIAIATTHTQARYVLPFVVEKFLSLHPHIRLNIQQGTPEQVAALVEQNDVDIAIATEVLAGCTELIALPCYQWSRMVIIPKDHPLAKIQGLSLEDIVQYPIITYVQGFTGRHRQDEVFEQHQLKPNIVLSAVDADVIKTYVRLGLGIGLIASMAFDQSQDKDLVVLDVEQLFGITTSLLAIKKDKYIKPYVYSFIEMFAPHLTESLIKHLVSCDEEERENILAKIALPRYLPFEV